MFGFGKKKTPARNTNAKRAAASKTGKAKAKTATRTKAKCTVCHQRRQVDTANKICGRHQCANVVARRLETSKSRAKKTTATKPATRKTTPKPAAPATSSRKTTQRASNTSVDTVWRSRCQLLEACDELLKSGELNPADTKATKEIAAEARAYTRQQFATAYRTDRGRYEGMCRHVAINLTQVQTVLKSVRATQATRAGQR